MANKDLFKQAIAEAKSIREAAIANAKEALEESLTPHLKDMLAAKLQEMDDSSVEEEVVNETEEVEEAVEETVEGEDHSDEAPMEEVSVEEAEDEAEEVDAEEAEDDSEESEDEAGELEDEEEVEVKDMEVDDLKDLIRDIIASEMGGGEEELGNDDMDAGAEVEPEGDMEVGAEDEEIDLDELLAELESASNEEVEEEVTEEIEEGEKEVKKEEVKEENSELNEALSTISTLQNQLQEVNLLNAKLLYVNKVFKSNNLNEAQKVNIIAAFDKAETVKEVKLVFETVSDNIVAKKPTKVNESKLGMASKATGTTAAKPEVISEVSNAVKRMQKLAGII